MALLAERHPDMESATLATCVNSVAETPEPKSAGDSRSRSPPVFPDDSGYPDGGFKAWLTVFGAVLALFCCGQLTAFGVFETWYAENQLRDLPASTISWIGSLQLWILYFSGGFLGRIFDAYGPRVILIPGSIVLVVSTMLTSVCMQYYQFLLVQGLLTGLSYGMLFYPTFASISTHFRRYRATAVGIAIAGSGVGGVVFPIMYRHLFSAIGFGWAVRASGFLCLALCTISCVTITSRLPPGRKNAKVIPDAAVVRDTPFVLLVAGCLLVNFALFIPFVYLADYAIYREISSGTSFYIISAMNAGSIFGRIAPPFLADTVGRFNIVVPTTFLMGLLALVFWTFAKSLMAIVLFAVVYGCFSGAFLAMQIPCIAQISNIGEVGTRIGILYSVASFGVLAGGPAAGAVLRGDGGSYTGMIVLCGVVNILGSLLLLWSKCRVNPRLFARV
ncbi:MFS general substrate transporter [Pilatotrama ljubarskyi]|nr:MFS general substrate transporter [Pilatotrama ljubarskyi]